MIFLWIFASSFRIRIFCLIGIAISLFFLNPVLESMRPWSVSENNKYAYFVFYSLFIPANMFGVFLFFKPRFLNGRDILKWYLLFWVFSLSGSIFYGFYFLYLLCRYGV